MKKKGDNWAYLIKYTDEMFIDALREALENPTVTASKVAAITGCNPRYAVVRLVEMAEEGKIEAVMESRSWGFRLKKHDALDTSGNKELHCSGVDGLCA